MRCSQHVTAVTQLGSVQVAPLFVDFAAAGLIQRSELGDLARGWQGRLHEQLGRLSERNPLVLISGMNDFMRRILQRRAELTSSGAARSCACLAFETGRVA